MEGTKSFISTEGKTDWQCKKMRTAVKNGELVRVRKGVYASPTDFVDTMIDIEKIVPHGVLCMWSAWSVHRLTTQIPNSYCIAIERKRKVRLPKFPEFSLYYQSEEQLQLGRTEMVVSGYHIQIFDVERCVCDAIKHRNKIGIDVMAEVVQTYLRRNGRDISKLIMYAKQLRVANILDKYLELWQ